MFARRIRLGSSAAVAKAMAGRLAERIPRSARPECPRIRDLLVERSTDNLHLQR
jgi:hypothetical protein